MWRNPVHFMASGFGIGATPVMPGTFGTLLGVMLYEMLVYSAWSTRAGVIGFLFLVGIYLCGRTSRDWGVEDHPAIVWDESVSFPLVMMAIPSTWYYVVGGFILFRFFDILKPWPICWLDRHIKGGLGIMLDDVAAALCAWGVLYVVFYLTVWMHSAL